MDIIKAKLGEHEIMYCEYSNKWKVPESLLPDKDGYDSLAIAKEWINNREKKIAKKPFIPFAAIAHRYGFEFVTVTSINDETGKAYTKGENGRGVYEIKYISPKDINAAEYAALEVMAGEKKALQSKVMAIEKAINTLTATMKPYGLKP